MAGMDVAEANPIPTLCNQEGGLAVLTNWRKQKKADTQGLESILYIRVYANMCASMWNEYRKEYSWCDANIKKSSKWIPRLRQNQEIWYSQRECSKMTSRKCELFLNPLLCRRKMKIFIHNVAKVRSPSHYLLEVIYEWFLICSQGPCLFPGYMFPKDTNPDLWSGKHARKGGGGRDQRDHKMTS